MIGAIAATPDCHANAPHIIREVILAPKIAQWTILNQMWSNRMTFKTQNCLYKCVCHTVPKLTRAGDKNVEYEFRTKMVQNLWKIQSTMKANTMSTEGTWWLHAGNTIAIEPHRKATRIPHDCYSHRIDSIDLFQVGHDGAFEMTTIITKPSDPKTNCCECNMNLKCCMLCVEDLTIIQLLF